MKKRILAVALMLLLTINLITGCGLLDSEKKPGSNASTTMVDKESVYRLGENEAFVVINQVEYPERAKTFDGKWYLPYGAVKKLNDRFYWNANEEQMIITTADSVNYYWPDSSACRKNGEDLDAGAVNIKFENGSIYVSVDLLKEYTGFTSSSFDDTPKRIVINTDKNETATYTASKKDTCIRVAAALSADILTKVAAGDVLYVDSTAEDMGEFVRVSTNDGYCGYVQVDDVSAGDTCVFDSGFSETEYTHNLLAADYATIVWHSVGGSVSSFNGEISGTEGIDVVIPTWYAVISTDGSISSNANAAYVVNAHNLGLEVWGLVNDFTDGVPGIEVLSNTTSRINLETQLINSAIENGLDGINIDFEYITVESGPHYIQFLRELSIMTRKNGLKLSVDNYVPTSGNPQYNLEAQSQVVDYIMLMTYDEHYSVDNGIGSVASKGFVENGVDAALKYIEPSRLMMGIPFYTRLWETAGDGTQSMQTLTMQAQNEVLAKYAPDTTWDEEAGQYYVAYTNSESKTCEMWLEETESITVKRQIANDKALGGVACWCLGYEDDAVWDILK